jgi:hypothetical protein
MNFVHRTEFSVEQAATDADEEQDWLEIGARPLVAACTQSDMQPKAFTAASPRMRPHSRRSTKEVARRGSPSRDFHSFGPCHPNADRSAVVLGCRRLRAEPGGGVGRCGDTKLRAVD